MRVAEVTSNSLEFTHPFSPSLPPLPLPPSLQGTEVDVVALLNDTTGTQLAVGHHDSNCMVGLILGTGTNACYLERLDAVHKFTGDRSKHSHVIINCEWGAFGDGGEMDPWLTDFDRELDTKVLNPGQQV